ncbi:hypothetical protein PM082_006456 [Marasmius tenuissimus]|nr:hypothetical protein PM082_006456 [Marasmius tenuissimus]
MPINIKTPIFQTPCVEGVGRAEGYIRRSSVWTENTSSSIDVFNPGLQFLVVLRPKKIEQHRLKEQKHGYLATRSICMSDASGMTDGMRSDNLPYDRCHLDNIHLQALMKTRMNQLPGLTRGYGYVGLAFQSHWIVLLACHCRYIRAG